MKAYRALFIAALSAACVSCLHDPSAYEGGTSAGTSASSTADFGTIYPVDGGKQICNPSVSSDTVNYPASMLWLNFSGSLSVKDAPVGYTTSGVAEHDRLTVSDTAGKVLWFVLRDSVPGAECQFQDPEWSASPDYIVALGGRVAKGAKSCDDAIDYGILAFRMSDKNKKPYWFYKDSISELATPHLWVGSASAAVDSSDSLGTFFGTDSVKLVYVSEDDKVIFVDFANGGKRVTLPRPSGRSGWMMDSPLISPDGKWITYNILEDSFTWESYIQELAANSTPVKIPTDSTTSLEPVQPHWWQFGSRLFVVWAEFPSGNAWLNKADLTNASAQDGSVGRTCMREVKLTAGAPMDIAVEWTGAVREIASVPFTGGRSPDGHFLATGTNNGYLLMLP